MTEVKPKPASAAKRKTDAANAAVRLLPTLIEAFRWQQKGKLQSVSDEMAEVLDATHPAVSRKLKSAVDLAVAMRRLPTMPEHLVSFDTPRYGLTELVLDQQVLDETQRFIKEHNRREELAAFSLQPRHKVLLYGPPGNGKTMLAEAMAYELDVPLLNVKYGGLMDSHLGGTGKNINAILEYAQTSPCVLFFDEFDGVGAARNSLNDVAELRRVTNQLLIQLERLPSDCVFIAATNEVNLLDKALHRRFDITINIEAPGDALKIECACRELSVEKTPGHNITGMAEMFASPALKNLSSVVGLCRELRRDLVLNEGEGLSAILELHGLETTVCET